MAKVYTVKQSSYDQESVNSAVKKIFSHFGGIERCVKKGDNVLLKANMLSASEIEKRVTTDPSVVRAVAAEVISAGGKPVICDSPGLDKFSNVAKKSGLAAVAEELKIPCEELAESVELPNSKSAIFHKIEVSKKIFDADAIINLPKMKTHGQMVLTLGVKNLFGTVVAQRKAEWHYKVGLRRDLFASLLIDIYMGIKPSFTILDGVWGMEGMGPANGKPRNFSLLAGAENPLTLDFHMCKLLGLPLEEFPLWQAAKQRNLPEAEISDGDLEGDFSHPFKFDNVDIPKLCDMRVMLKIPLLESFLTSKPVQDIKKCVQCLRCIEICPARAIKLKEDKMKLEIDYKKCIRCYCCHE
ncbi:MAG: DUF362 domain-containing protein, partial [Synergistaceae bacterium]|nr:DUF362 domain-containing protein [Synergistaceae bacterium]